MIFRFLLNFGLLYLQWQIVLDLGKKLFLGEKSSVFDEINKSNKLAAKADYLWQQTGDSAVFFVAVTCNNLS